MICLKHIEREGISLSPNNSQCSVLGLLDLTIACDPHLSFSPPWNSWLLGYLILPFPPIFLAAPSGSPLLVPSQSSWHLVFKCPRAQSLNFLCPSPSFSISFAPLVTSSSLKAFQAICQIYISCPDYHLHLSV